MTAATTPLPGTGRFVSRPVAAALGVILAALIVAAVLVVVASFDGTFGDYVTVHAVLPAGANAPQVDSPVEYRDVTVGQVASQGNPVGDGRVSIVLRLKPSELDAIPRSVRATVGPLSIFGNQYVDLQALSGTGGPALAGGETIDPIPSGPSASLQATIANFYDVLEAIQPLQLESTLTTIATGLRGQGEDLGSALHAASDYLKAMIPLLPTFEHDLGLLAPVAKDLSGSTPELLGVLRNLSVTARTIVADGGGLRHLLQGGSVVAGQAASLFATISRPLEHLIADSGPLLSDVSANSNEIADILAGLDGWSRAWTAAESHGPYLSITSTISVPNAADLVLAALGAPDPSALFAAGLGAGRVNPATYTAADCPRYASMQGTGCDVTTSVENERAVDSVTAAVNHGQAPASPAVATLLLGPVLDAMTSGS